MSRNGGTPRKAVPPISWGPNQYDQYNPAKDRYEKIMRVGSAPENFVWDTVPGCKVVYVFHGVDYDGARNTLDVDNPLYTTKVGAAGTITAVNALFAGMDMTTGGVANNSILVATGDAAGMAQVYNVSEEVYFTANFRFPNAADITNVSVIAGLYLDANNYIGVRLDTAVDGNLYFVTRAPGGAGETITSLGAADLNWHRMWMYTSAARCWIVLDGGATVAHTTNIPAGDLSGYAYIETLNGVVKHLQFR